MIKRSIISDIQERLSQFPVISILGPRQSGKTTLAKELIKNNKNALYLDLELPSDMQKFNDPEWFLSQFSDKLIVIDEVQRMPDLFPLLRALVDIKRTNGRFLLLGSASSKIEHQCAESLAGRIYTFEINALSIFETKDQEKTWLRGGFPCSFLAKTDEESLLWRESFLQSFLERDIPQLFSIKLPTPQLQRFLHLLAQNNAQCINIQNISNALNISAQSVQKYIDIFESSFIIRQMYPYSENIKKRLVKRPKIFFRDSGLLHSLLNLSSINTLFASSMMGNSWESFVVEQIHNILPERWQSFFMRSQAGAEIDLLLLTPSGKKIAIEVKHSLSPKLSKGFYNLSHDIQSDVNIIITPGKDSFLFSENIYQCGLEKLPELFKKLF